MPLFRWPNHFNLNAVYGQGRRPFVSLGIRFVSAAGHDKALPDRGEPGSVRHTKNRSREYGFDGRPIRDYDKPHQGYERDHVHEWEEGVREHPGRDYSPWPRK